MKVLIRIKIKKKNKQKKAPKAPKAPEITKKLKILCLHGYAQNVKIFQKRTAVLKKALKSVAELCKFNYNYSFFFFFFFKLSFSII